MDRSRKKKERKRREGNINLSDSLRNSLLLITFFFFFRYHDTFSRIINRESVKKVSSKRKSLLQIRGERNIFKISEVLFKRKKRVFFLK